MQNALVVTGDRALWRGTIAGGIIREHGWYEAMHFHAKAAFREFRDLREARRAANRFLGEEAEKQEQIEFYKVLVRLGLDEAKISRFSHDYISLARVDPVADLIRDYRADHRMVFLTNASSTSTLTYARKDMFVLPLSGLCCNGEVFDGNKLVGFNLLVNNGEQKLEAVLNMLKSRGLTLAQCAYIGANAMDIPLLRSAGEAFTSPYAIEEMINMPGVTQIKD